MAQRRRRRLQREVISFRLDMETAAKLRAAAAREERLVGWLVRRLVEQGLERLDARPAA